MFEPIPRYGQPRPNDWGPKGAIRRNFSAATSCKKSDAPPQTLPSRWGRLRSLARTVCQEYTCGRSGALRLRSRYQNPATLSGLWAELEIRQRRSNSFAVRTNTAGVGTRRADSRNAGRQGCQPPSTRLSRELRQPGLGRILVV